jgi:hypothetical protein
VCTIRLKFPCIETLKGLSPPALAVDNDKNARTLTAALRIIATSQSLRLTIEYIEIFPHNLLNSSTRDVDLIFYWGGLYGNFAA